MVFTLRKSAIKSSYASLCKWYQTYGHSTDNSSHMWKTGEWTQRCNGIKKQIGSSFKLMPIKSFHVSTSHRTEPICISDCGEQCGPSFNDWSHQISWVNTYNTQQLFYYTLILSTLSYTALFYSVQLGFVVLCLLCSVIFSPLCTATSTAAHWGPHKCQ